LVNQLKKQPLEEYPNPEGSLGQALPGPSPSGETAVSFGAREHEGSPIA